MAQLETNEGAGEENDDEMIEWLKANKLSKYKQQFTDHDVTLDDLRELDLDELKSFISDDLQLSGIAASRTRKAIISLQQNTVSTSTQSPLKQKVVRIILSKEEGDAIKEINDKHDEVKQYVNELNGHIDKLNNTAKENINKIDEIEKELQQTLQTRMRELRNIANDTIIKKKQNITSHIEAVKIYESALEEAKQKHDELLNDEQLNATKRQFKILEINKNMNNNTNIMNNKPIFNPIVTIECDTKKITNIIQQIGKVNSYDLPKAPEFIVTNISASSAKIEFQAMQSNLECVVEISNNANQNDENDEKNSNWQTLFTLTDKTSYECKNLSPNKLYNIRSKYQNKFGSSKYSKVIAFTTKKDLSQSYQDLKCYICSTKEPGKMTICNNKSDPERNDVYGRDGYSAICSKHVSRIGANNYCNSKANF